MAEFDKEVHEVRCDQGSVAVAPPVDFIDAAPSVKNPILAPRPESYKNRLRKMSAKQLTGELRRQGKQQLQDRQFHGVIFASILSTVFASTQPQGRIPMAGGLVRTIRYMRG